MRLRANINAESFQKDSWVLPCMKLETRVSGTGGRIKFDRVMFNATEDGQGLEILKTWTMQVSLLAEI